MGRNVLVDRLIVGDRLGHAAFLGFHDAGDVDGKDDVCGRIRTFRLDALDKALVQEEDVGLDTSSLGELVQQRFDQVRLPVGVDVHFTVCQGMVDR